MSIASSILSRLRLRRRPARVRRRLRWLGLTLLLVLLLGRVGLGTPQPHSPQMVFEQWRSHYQNQAYDAALESLTPLLDSENISAANRALAYNYQALTQQKQGDWQQARAAIERSWQLLDPQQDSTSLNPPQQRILAAVLTTRGQIQLALGQPNLAYESWRQATAYYRQLGHEEGVTGGLLNQAQALQELGFTVRACDTLLSLLGRSRSVREPQSPISSCQRLQGQSPVQIQDWLAQMTLETPPHLQTPVLQSLGTVLQALGDLDAAEGVLRQAEDRLLAQAEGVGPSLALDLGNLYGARARRYQQLGMFQTPFREARTRSLGYYRRTSGQTPEQRLRSQLNELLLWVDLDLRGDNPNPDPQALETVQTLLATIPPQLEQLPLSRQRVYHRVSLACVLLACDRPQDSPHLPDWGIPLQTVEGLLQQAGEEAEQLGDNRAASYVWGAWGRLAQVQGRLSQAQEYSERAIAQAESLGADELLYRWYWQLARLQTAQGLESLAAYDGAFESLKRLEAKVMTDDGTWRFSGRYQVAPLYQEYAQRLFAIDSMTQGDLEKAIEVMDALQVAEINDFFGLACLEVRSRDLRDYPDTAVIHIFTFPERFELILEESDGTLNRQRVEFPEDIGTFLDSLQLSLQTNFDYQESLTRLYRALITPIEADLEALQPQQLVFVLYGKIRQIPMAALYDSQQYLIESYPIAIAPSLELLEPRGLEVPQLRAIAAGRQNFETLGDSLDEMSSSLSWLPLDEVSHLNLHFVEQELRGIGELIPSKLLFDQDFTIEALEQEIRSLNYPLVHIASHGRFSNFAEDTFILADRPLGIRQLADILNVQDRTRHNDIDLLVLSACETARESDRALLGMAGMAARAGVRTIIGSFWAVDDQSTALMMQRFYQGLKEAQNDRLDINKAEALRQAQIAMIRGEFGQVYSHPYFWAPFVLIGHWK
ncbi:CHAT domain-containing tetratricopeptide repeat protein [Sodalinema gerasimenkoae]|uniref:CHAT domain-containing tetratricopeptide repeat protein n=1 Tax=Sodalinema gerasimenkoae TaxID=2862348 RepID=UPI00135AFB3D|nr:CHAT domain-containing protein [Sodalinema gerasimenkoae]